MSILEMMETMNKLEAAANLLLSGTVTELDQEMAGPLMAKYHELGDQLADRTGIDIRKQPGDL